MYRIFISAVVLTYSGEVNTNNQMNITPTLEHKPLSIIKESNSKKYPKIKNNFNIEIDYESYSFIVLDNGQK